MKVVMIVLLFIWQILQNLVGLGFLLYCKMFKSIEKVERDTGEVGISVYLTDCDICGVSLGMYVFLGKDWDMTDDRVIQHELGHCKQSMILGVLYLIVIGIPSALSPYNASVFVNGIKYDNPKYFSRYTEKWADKLAKISRRFP